MAGINHLNAAGLSVGAIRSGKDRTHLLLSDVYLLLSRDLTEESRTSALDKLNEAMRELRMTSESIDYVDIAHKGIDADLFDLSARIRAIRTS